MINHPNFYGHDYGANITLPAYNENGTYTLLSIAKGQSFGHPTASNGPTGPGGPHVTQLAAKVYF